MLQKAKKKFPFLKNDVVLARYGTELYYAKIISINYKRKLAKLLFDDDSKEEISFKKIFSGKETMIYYFRYVYRNRKIGNLFIHKNCMIYEYTSFSLLVISRITKYIIHESTFIKKILIFDILVM